MERFSHRPNLYRTTRWIVILSVLAVLSYQLLGQVSRGTKVVDKGPRALGLLQILPGGKAHLIPVAILINGNFYDASVYKASPVPMALWSETEYEGFKTGVSEGLFTVAGALQNQQTKEWIGEGTWQTSAELQAKGAATKKQASSVPRGLNQDEGPPVLRHSGAKPKPPEQPASQPAPAQPSSAPPSAGTPPSSPTTAQPAAPPSPAPSPQPAKPTAPSPSASTPPTNSSATGALTPESSDPNRPSLKRGKPAEAPVEPLPSASAAPAKVPAQQQPVLAKKRAMIQVIPAISDSGGADPRSYSYSMKTDEEQQFQKKMLELASDEVRARVKMLSGETTPKAPVNGRKKVAPKPAQPSFDEFQLHVFDLFGSNEPILVLNATTRMIKTPANGRVPPELQYFVTLVARQDINGDYHKAFSIVTDEQHLDVEPRYDLIDAVDADGDGRGELLFRKVYDSGESYVIYRVIGDQLYALFDSTPGA